MQNIFIDCVGFSCLDLAVLIQDKTFVLKYRNARLAHYAKLKEVNSEVAVKRSHRAFQVALVRCGNDRARLRYDFRFFAFFVENESNRVGCDFHRVFGVFRLIFRRFEVAKPYRLRCVVDEFPRDGRFHAESLSVSTVMRKFLPKTTLLFNASGCVTAISLSSSLTLLIKMRAAK